MHPHPLAGLQLQPVAIIAGPGPGHNAWQMTSTALVLFMTLPGLALFYGGLVRSKNVLSILAMTMGIAGLVTILWFLCGYSLTFSGGNAFLGDLAQACFNGMKPGNVGAGYYWISDSMWSMFQLSFAIITPALIVGAIAERMKFLAVLVFVALWMFAVYFPFAHMVWATTGFMCGPLNPDAGIKAIDFAGGTVVHMSSGWSALILCMILGKRLGFGKEPMQPHSMVMCMIGTGMLWVGWYGFNAGSALNSGTLATSAFAATHFHFAQRGQGGKCTGQPRDHVGHGQVGQLGDTTVAAVLVGKAAEAFDQTAKAWQHTVWARLPPA
jgi:Amt family ammonium transporter